MAEWISVYCRRRVELDAEAMRRALDDADLWTLAEGLVPENELEAAVKSAVRNLRIEAVPEGRTRIAVHWKPEGRPILITEVTGPAATEQIAETLDDLLPPASGPGPARVREHLNQSRQVVNLEMGIQDAQHLGATLGEVLAFFVAEEGDGLVWFFDREWASPDDRGTTIWTTTNTN